MKKHKKELSMQRRNALIGYLFFSPWLIGFAIITLYPIVNSIRISLNELQITTDGIKMTAKGMQYYFEALRVDTVFTTNLIDAVLFILCSTPVIIVISLVIALFLTKSYPLRGFFRGVFFLPVIIMSGPVISELLGNYSIALTDDLPVLYSLLSALPPVVRTPVFLILDNLVLILWFSGVQILIFISAINKINPALYEAASIDGATGWEMFWKITLPYTKAFALLNAVYTVMELANYSNLAVNGKILGHLHEVGRPYSFSAAMSWIYCLTVLLLVFVVFVLFGGLSRKEK